MELQEFLRKSREREAKRIKRAGIEVEGYGNITFVRPKDDDLYEYISELANSTEVDPETKKVKKIDMKGMSDASSKLVYLSCPLLQSKEVRDEYPNLEPFAIPLQVFDREEVMDLASKIDDIFGGRKAKQEAEEKIKN